MDANRVHVWILYLGLAGVVGAVVFWVYWLARLLPLMLAA